MNKFFKKNLYQQMHYVLKPEEISQGAAIQLSTEELGNELRVGELSVNRRLLRRSQLWQRTEHSVSIAGIEENRDRHSRFFLRIGHHSVLHAFVLIIRHHLYHQKHNQ